MHQAQPATVAKRTLLRLVARSTKANVDNLGCEIRRLFYVIG